MRTSAIILSITVATTVVTLGCDGGFTSLDEEQQPREGELEPNDDDDDKPTDEQPVDEEDPAPVVPLALGLETPLPSDTIFDDDGGLDPDLHTGLNDVERALLEQVRGARGWPAEVTPALPSLDSLDELPFDAADARPVLVQFPLGELPFTVELSGDIVRLLPERPLVRARE